jgi:hypothetical protein
MTLTRAQIGDLERERIAEALRDIEDVLQQMGVEPKLIGFIHRIRRPVRSIASTIELTDAETDNVVKLEGLRKAPTLRIVDGIEASRIDPAEPFLKAMLATNGAAYPKVNDTIPTADLGRPSDSEPVDQTPPGAA